MIQDGLEEKIRRIKSKDVKISFFSFLKPNLTPEFEHLYTTNSVQM